MIEDYFQTKKTKRKSKILSLGDQQNLSNSCGITENYFEYFQKFFNYFFPIVQTRKECQSVEDLGGKRNKLFEYKKKNTLLILGSDGAGKNSLVETIFKFTSSEKTSRLKIMTPNDHPLQIYISNSYSYEFINSLNQNFDLIWYLIDLGIGRILDSDIELINNLSRERKMVILFNKKDLEPEDKSEELKVNLTKRLLDIRNIIGIIKVSSLEAPLLYYTKCERCSSTRLILDMFELNALCKVCKYEKSIKNKNDLDELIEISCSNMDQYFRNMLINFQYVNIKLKYERFNNIMEKAINTNDSVEEFIKDISILFNIWNDEMFENVIGSELVSFLSEFIKKTSYDKKVIIPSISIMIMKKIKKEVFNFQELLDLFVKMSSNGFESSIILKKEFGL